MRINPGNASSHFPLALLQYKRISALYRDHIVRTDRIDSACCQHACRGLDQVRRTAGTIVKEKHTMATDFRKLAAELCLADGKIDETEVKIIKKALYEDGKIQQKEAEFLIDLRGMAQKKAKGRALKPAFENFFFRAIQDSVLDNGYTGRLEASLFCKAIFADCVKVKTAKEIMKRLKTAAKKTSPQFDRLYREVVA